MTSTTAVHILVLFVAATGSLAFIGIFARRHYIYVGVAVLAYFILFYTGRDALESGQLWRVSIFAGTIFVTIGWIVTNEVAIYNSRKQHTITMVTDYITNTVFIEDRAVWSKYLPKITDKLTEEIVDFDEESHELCLVIDRKLNYFEFMAIGLETGDLDENVAKRSFRDLLIALCDQLEPYFAHWQKRSPDTWRHLTDLYARWSKDASS